MNTKRVLFKALIVLLFVCIFPLSASAEENVNGKGYLLVVDKLQLEDIDPAITPAIHSVVDKGALGLASNRTLRGHNPLDTSLTIGAGNLDRAYNNGIMAYNTDEIVKERKKTAGELYQSLSHYSSEAYDCLMVNIPEMVAGIESENVTTVPGAMGELLAQNGYYVCVLGNGDLVSSLSRNAVAIAMDQKGGVPLGNVGSDMNISVPTSYLSLETDYDALKKGIQAYEDKADLFIIDLSDLARLEEADTALPEIMAQEKEIRLQKIDSFVQFVLTQMDMASDQLWILAPSTTRNAIASKNYFTPILTIGSGVENGYLTSGATRREYIIANTDIAPGILNFFGIKPPSQMMIGRSPIAIASEEDTLEKAKMISDSTARVNRLRPLLIKGYVFILIVVILISLISIFMIHKWIRILEYFLVGLAAVPLVLLVLGKIPLPYDWLYILLAVGLTIIVTVGLLAGFKGNSLKAFVALALLTVLGINLDLFTGSSMIQSSVLGYDPMAGARYYGVGNEFMGILMGCTIATAALIYEKTNKPWMLAVIGGIFFLECYVIAGPSIGANSDGFITAPFAFLVTLVLLGDIRMRPGVLLGIGLIIMLAVAGVSIYDVHRPIELQSHIGRAVTSILDGGWQQAGIIISRKAAMNIKLIKYTIWSRVFIVILFALIILLVRPVGAMRKLRQKRPYLVKGFAGIIAGSLVGLIVNDSGIVLASTASIYLVVPLLLLMLQQQRNKLV
ncbi:MAG: hypothetical protein U9N81_03935 [Bacillota bacterium]|nr:hypothetical protein [Bacillota bacterium]